MKYRKRSSYPGSAALKVCKWIMHVDTNFVGLPVQKIYIISLSEGVFERRKSTTNKAFSFNMPKRDNVFLAECRYSHRGDLPKRFSKTTAQYAKSTLPVDIRLSKPPFLELPNDVH